LEANIHKTVVAVAEHELEHHGALPLTRGAVASVTEMATLLFDTLLEDAMAFAQHAGRRNVGERDVLLCARRTKQNHAQLLAFLDATQADDVASASATASSKSKPRPKKKRPAVLLDDDPDADRDDIGRDDDNAAAVVRRIDAHDDDLDDL
jgi:histone H3/H4